MSTSTEILDGFCGQYDPRPPCRERIRGPEEIQQLQASGGLRFLTPAPVSDVLFGSPSSSRAPSANTYLWVIDMRGIPYILECRKAAIGSVPKHTNLTGGGEAYLGGELWFTSKNSLYLSGGSGRYPPRNAGQLDEATEVFRSFGYEVTSLGWDDVAQRALRDLEEGK